MQRSFQFSEDEKPLVAPFKTQLLKWIGSKQRFAHEIVGYFPAQFHRYFEPFLGSGAVLGTLAPESAVASDIFAPLLQVWQALRESPEKLKRWYSERSRALASGDKVTEYEKIKAAYNAQPNGADLVFLCRSCYGGVVRFRKADGYMSTPCGIHQPISPNSFARRVDEWYRRTNGTEFVTLDYRDAMALSRKGDLVYCDPPYTETQSILYGAQDFQLKDLLETITQLKSRGVYVVLSIDGTKRSGNRVCNVPIPDGLFEREVSVNCGRSMLRRFQMGGQTLEGEVVADRLFLTY